MTVTVTPGHVAAAIACKGVIVTHASIDVGWISVGPRWQYENGLAVGWLKILADHSIHPNGRKH